MARNAWNIEINTAELKLKLNRNKNEALNDVGTFILAKMNFYVAVDTGFLRSRNEANTKIAGEVMEFQNDCLYAGYQEYGTRYQPGTPFMRPAALNHIGDIQRICARGIGNGI